jgi:hypothetical protein
MAASALEPGRMPAVLDLPILHWKHNPANQRSPLLADGGFAIGGHDAKSGDPFGMHACSRWRAATGR